MLNSLQLLRYFAARPANVELIVRACQNRLIEAPATDTSALLFSFIDSMPEQGRFTLDVPPTPRRKARQAELAVRFGRTKVCKPRNGAGQGLPAYIEINVVDIRETSKPADGDPIHWRLFTTHEVASFDQALAVARDYRGRWAIEEYNHTLKTAGFNIESTEISDPEAMMRFAAAAAVSAITVMQLVKARDGTTGQNAVQAVMTRRELPRLIDDPAVLLIRRF